MIVLEEVLLHHVIVHVMLDCLLGKTVQVIAINYCHYLIV